MVAYLQAENAYADTITAGAALQETLYRGDAVANPADRLERSVSRGRVPLLLPHRRGKAVPDPLPEARSLEAPEQVLLDLNQMAEGHRFMALGAYAGER